MPALAKGGKGRLAGGHPFASHWPVGETPNAVNFALETAHSGLGQNARTTGGAGILPAAILREVRLGRLKLTVLGETPTLLDPPLARQLGKPAPLRALPNNLKQPE